MADEQGKGGDGQDGQPAGDTGKVLDYAAWIQEQPDEIKGAIETHTAGLKKALETERDERKRYQAELREAAKKLEAGSEARKALEEHAAKLQETERMAQFYDAAHTQGCSNLRLAYLAATDAGLVRNDGSADWETLKARVPELFGRREAPPPPPPGHPGSGHNQTTSRPGGVSAWIRQQAGR